RARAAVRRAARTLPVKSARDAHLPAAHPPPERVLGSPRLRATAALRHGNGRGDLPHRDVFARDRPRALERSLRAAFPPSQGRSLWRQPEPAATLLPVP